MLAIANYNDEDAITNKCFLRLSPIDDLNCLLNISASVDIKKGTIEINFTSYSNNTYFEE